ncbi:MAG: retroviral-like aspartic protease family protein [Caldilineaceae bacterium]
MAVYTYLFDETESPSMPTMDVTLIEPGSGASLGPIRALVDTGADGTLAPDHLLEQIGAVAIGRGRLRWLWDESRHVQIYLVRLEIGPHVLRSAHVAGVPRGTEFILGRNVLNHLVFTIDGPAGVIELST